MSFQIERLLHPVPRHFVLFTYPYLLEAATRKIVHLHEFIISQLLSRKFNMNK